MSARTLLALLDRRLRDAPVRLSEDAREASISVHDLDFALIERVYDIPPVQPQPRERRQ